MVEWAKEWFNEDYAKLYAYHDQEEAEQQVAFIVEALHLKGDERVLDIGCGAGRHLIAFAKRGYSVVGIDCSAYMLGVARQRLEGVGSVHLHHTDVLQFREFGAFDVALSLFTSFGYSSSDKENQAILIAVASLLSDHGQLFLDYLHPEDVKATLKAVEKKNLDGTEVVIEKALVSDQVVKKIRFPHRTYEERVKLYTKEQIEAMLDKAGFGVKQVWSDYLGSAWNEGGPRQLFWAKKNAPIP